MLDSNFDAPSLLTIRCCRGTIGLLGGSKIDEKITMVPSAWITKSRCSWNDDLTNSLPPKVLVSAETNPNEKAIRTRCIQ